MTFSGELVGVFCWGGVDTPVKRSVAYIYMDVYGYGAALGTVGDGKGWDGIIRAGWLAGEAAKYSVVPPGFVFFFVFFDYFCDGLGSIPWTEFPHIRARSSLSISWTWGWLLCWD